MRDRLQASTIVSAFLFILARLGVIQVLDLSEKGRLTQFVERIEPFIRRKIIRWKWFPPILIAVSATDSPNIAVESYFSQRVVFVRAHALGRLASILRPRLSDLADALIKPLRYLKRPGSPWEMSSSIRRRDDWTIETNALLERMNIAPETPIVLLAVRDAAYYMAIRGQIGISAGPETLPDTFIRNPHLETYLLVVTRLRAQGFVVVYFGFPVSPLPSCLIGQVVDYAGQYRSARGDLLLGRYCSLLSSGASGTWAFASLFNKPVAYSNNYLPFHGGYLKRDRFTPQLMFSKDKQRLLSFQEMVDTQWEYTFESNCKRDGISLIKNTPEEITDLVLETLQRDSGTFVETSEDRLLAARFSKIQALSPPPKERHGAIATTFLRRHAHLLD